MKEEGGNEAEEDALLDPIAKSILRDLQDEMADEAQHPTGLFSEVNVTDQFSVVPLGLPCDEEDLGPNEVIHCNMALEQDTNDAAGFQGGQNYVAPTPAPTAAPVATRFDADGNPDPHGLYDTDGNVLRFDENGNPDPNGLYDAEGDEMHYDQYGNPHPNGLYDADGNVLRFDENGRPDPNGTHDATGNAFPTTAAPTTHPPSVVPSTVRSVPPSISFAPTVAPTTAPIVAAEDATEPSYHPTLRGDPWRLRGTVYYDHNANGRRDSMMQTLDFGDDAEFTYGLGGVTIKLVECDPETNRALDAEAAEAEDSYASTVTQGVDVLMHPKIVGREENGGIYNLIDIRINRSYYIYAEAPEGYIFTGGICNDDVRYWECRYGQRAFSNGRRLGEPRETPQGRSLSTAAVSAPRVEADPREFRLGVRSGRSERCVSVDRRGVPDSRLDLGAMRIGDISFGDTEVQMSMDLLDPGLRRRLRESGILGRVLQDGVINYALLQKDEEAIKVVTAEVLASNLDEALSKKGAVLKSVVPLDIIFIAPEPEEVDDVVNTTEALNNNATTNQEVEGTSEALADQGDNSTTTTGEEDEEVVDTSGALTGEGNNSTAAANTGATAASQEGDIMAVSNQRPAAQRPPRSSPGRGGKLTVNVRVDGHYNKNNKNNVQDFDRIVQDSINRDAEVIREGLVMYNKNCQDQTTKVLQMGYTIDDYKEIHSDRGVDLPESRKNELKQMREGKIPDPLAAGGKAFSSACDKKLVLPEFFETSLGGFKVKAKTPTRVYVVEEESVGPWVIIVAVVVALALTLCLGGYLFRRGFKRSSSESDLDYYTDSIGSVFDDDDGVEGVNSRDLGSSAYEEGTISRDLNYKKNEKVRKNEEDMVRAKEMSSVASPIKPKKPGFFTRVVYRELGNMTAALTGDRWRFGEDRVRKSESIFSLEDPMRTGVGNAEARLHQTERKAAPPWQSDNEHSGSGKCDMEETDSTRRLSHTSSDDNADPADAMIARKVSERNMSYSSGSGSGSNVEGNNRSLMSRGMSYRSDRSPGAFRVSIDGSVSVSNDGSVHSLRSPGASFVSGDGSHRSPSSCLASLRPIPTFIGQETIEEEGNGDEDNSNSGSSDGSDDSDSSSDSSSSDDDEAREGRKNGLPREDKKGRARRKRGGMSKGKPKKYEAPSANRLEGLESESLGRHSSQPGNDWGAAHLQGRDLAEGTWAPPSLVMAPPKSPLLKQDVRGDLEVRSQVSRRSAASQSSRRSAASSHKSRRSAASHKSHRSAASHKSHRSGTSHKSHRSTASRKSHRSDTSHKSSRRKYEATSANRREGLASERQGRHSSQPGNDSGAARLRGRDSAEGTWTPPSLVMAPPKSPLLKLGVRGDLEVRSQASRRSAASQRSHRSAASQKSRRSATSQKSRVSATSHLSRW